MIDKTVKLLDRMEMSKTDCLARQDLSRKYLAHHEPESVAIILIDIIITIIIVIIKLIQ